MRKVSSSNTVAAADTQRRAPPGAAILSSENAPARLTRNSHAEEVHLQGAQGQTGNEHRRQKQGGLCRTSTSEASAKHQQQQHGRRYSTKRLLSSPGSRRCRVACSTWAAGCSACRAGSGRCLQQPGVAVHLKQSLNSNRPAATSCTLPHPQLPHRRSRSRAWHEYQAPKLMISHAPASSKVAEESQLQRAIQPAAWQSCPLCAYAGCWLLLTAQVDHLSYAAAKDHAHQEVHPACSSKASRIYQLDCAEHCRQHRTGGRHSTAMRSADGWGALAATQQPSWFAHTAP